jgi:hypothetical protein
MNIKALTKVLYGFSGVIFLLVGASVLLFSTGLLPAAVNRAVMSAARGDTNALHIVQEFGAFLVFIGLITIWFMRRYEQSRFFHWAMTAAFGLFALAHWFDVRGTFRSAVGPAVNSIPFALFLVVGLLRRSS